jgi:hypothetical protein
MVLFVRIVRSKLRGALTAALSGEETVYSNYAITHDAFSSDLTVDYRHSKILIVQSHEAKQVFSIKFSNPPNPSDWTSRGWWPPKALSPPQPPHSANPTHSNHPRTLPPKQDPATCPFPVESWPAETSARRHARRPRRPLAPPRRRTLCVSRPAKSDFR